MKAATPFAILAMIFMAASIRAADGLERQFWISTNTTEQFYSRGAAGSFDRPLDGSSQESFDSNMGSLPPDSTIHILPGVYETRGYWGGPFHVKTGQRIHGSGSEATILRFPPRFRIGGSGAVMLANTGAVTNVEICDLTCDCNILNNSDTYSGIILVGDQNTVRGVKVINCAHFGGNSEAWGIELTGPGPDLRQSRNNLIENCEVSHFNFAGGGVISSLVIYNGTGVIRGCRVILDGGGFAFSSTSGLIESNYVEGALSGFHGDTGDTTNLIMTHNTLVDCNAGVDMVNTARFNLVFSYNDFMVSNTAIPGQDFAFVLRSERGGGSYSNVLIIGNKIELASSAATRQNDFVFARNVTGLVIASNTVDSRLTNWIVHCSNVSMHDNRDLAGRHRPDLNSSPAGISDLSDHGRGPTLTP